MRSKRSTRGLGQRRQSHFYQQPAQNPAPPPAGYYQQSPYDSRAGDIPIGAPELQPYPNAAGHVPQPWKIGIPTPWGTLRINFPAEPVAAVLLAGALITIGTGLAKPAKASVGKSAVVGDYGYTVDHLIDFEANGTPQNNQPSSADMFRIDGYLSDITPKVSDIATGFSQTDINDTMRRIDENLTQIKTPDGFPPQTINDVPKMQSAFDNLTSLFETLNQTYRSIGFANSIPESPILKNGTKAGSEMNKVSDWATKAYQKYQQAQSTGKTVSLDDLTQKPNAKTLQNYLEALKHHLTVFDQRNSDENQRVASPQNGKFFSECDGGFYPTEKQEIVSCLQAIESPSLSEPFHEPDVTAPAASYELHDVDMNQPVIIKVNASDGGPIEFAGMKGVAINITRPDNSTDNTTLTSENNWTYTRTNLEGKYRVDIDAFDKSGNHARYRTEFNVSADHTNPILTDVIVPNNAEVGKNFNISANGTDEGPATLKGIDGYEVSFEDLGITRYVKTGENLIWKYDTTGSHIIKVKPKDKSGNWGNSLTKIVDIWKDTAAPEISTVSYKASINGTANEEQVVTFNVTDDRTGVSNASVDLLDSNGTLKRTVTAEKIGNNTYRARFTVFNQGEQIALGNYEARLRAVDGAGNEKILSKGFSVVKSGTNGTINGTVDTEPPEILNADDVYQTLSHLKQNQEFELKIKVRDNNGTKSVGVKVDGTYYDALLGADGYYHYTGKFAKSGKHNMTLVARDNDDNTNSSVAYQLNVEKVGKGAGNGVKFDFLLPVVGAIGAVGAGLALVVYRGRGGKGRNGTKHSPLAAPPKANGDSVGGGSSGHPLARDVYLAYGDGREIFHLTNSHDPTIDGAQITSMFTAVSAFAKDALRTRGGSTVFEQDGKRFVIEYDERQRFFVAARLWNGDAEEAKRRVKERVRAVSEIHGNRFEGHWEGNPEIFEDLKGDLKPLVTELFSTQLPSVPVQAAPLSPLSPPQNGQALLDRGASTSVKPRDDVIDLKDSGPDRPRSPQNGKPPSVDDVIGKLLGGKNKP